jgi:hypothetical protein
MSSTKNNDMNLSGAENSFRLAFERLKLGLPTLLPSGAAVSQNNVAREAGCDPSALKKARFPELVNEIKGWKKEQLAPVLTTRQSIESIRAKRRSLRARIEEVEAQRDRVVSLLLEADSKILELVRENEQLRSSLPASRMATAHLDGATTKSPI